VAAAARHLAGRHPRRPIVRTRLHTAATEWTQDARDTSYLYTGSLLEAATDTAARAAADPARHPPLTGSERDFLHASNKAHRRRIRRRRTLTAALLALVVCFAAAAVWALQASRNADQQRNVAVSRQLIAQSEALGDADPPSPNWKASPPGASTPPTTPATPCSPPPRAPASPPSPATPTLSTQWRSARTARH
jgi:hypothetical protein